MSQATRRRAFIRWAIRRDMPEVMAIENASFAEPYTEQELLTHLRRRNCIGMVAEVGADVAGFMVYTLHKGMIDIVDFAVSPKYRRRGVGSDMVGKLVSKLTTCRRTTLRILMHEESLSSLMFLKSQGFRAVSVHRHAFDGGTRDGFLMEYRLHWED